MEHRELLDSALARMHAARTAEDLEAVRVEVLGRKGIIAQLSKDMGKLSAEERVERGQVHQFRKEVHRKRV